MRLHIIVLFFIFGFKSLLGQYEVINNIDAKFVSSSRSTNNDFVYQTNQIFDVYKKSKLIGTKEIYIDLVGSLVLKEIKVDGLEFEALWNGATDAMQEGFLLSFSSRYFKNETSEISNLPLPPVVPKEIEKPIEKETKLKKKLNKSRGFPVEFSFILNLGYAIAPIANTSLLQQTTTKTANPLLNLLPSSINNNIYSGFLLNSLDFLIRIKPAYIGIRTSLATSLIYASVYQNPTTFSGLSYTPSINYLVTMSLDLTIPFFRKDFAEMYLYLGGGAGLRTSVNFTKFDAINDITYVGEAGLTVGIYSFIFGLGSKIYLDLQNTDGNISLAPFDIRIDLSVGFRFGGIGTKEKDDKK